ncbi:MAG: sulfur carrier protein ThiS [Candidatus Eremiobacteraeota bacterium]|nr:sulfur carrier protein ThiS [Candidatus Eremiobacteraeota bacterium]MBV8280659.1 sulfur carrier protein ThiS [Candidatus Eremiobacteraeota bacterium]
MPTFYANGELRDTQPGMTVASFLADSGLEPMRVVVEMNGEPLERSRFESTLIDAGDRIEVAQMVGGG